MKNVLTKKRVLIFSAIIATLKLVLVLAYSSSLFEWCYNRLWCQYHLIDTISFFHPFIIALLPLFLTSLITYFMREEVFRSWVRFAAWWVPLSMVLIFITPTEHGSFGIPGLLDPGFAAFVLSALFLIISFFFILWKWADVEDKKERAKK